jgi:hypothetical protein
MLRGKLIALAVATAALATGCASKPIILQDASTVLSKPVPKGMKVLILRPKITFESISDERPLVADAAKERTIREALTDRARSELISKEIRVEVPNETNGASGDIFDQSDRLLLNPDSLTYPFTDSEADGPNAFLFQRLRVKVGPRGTWDANSGAITSAMNTCHFQMVLISWPERRELWRGGFFLRELPNPAARTFLEGLSGIYKTLHTDNEKNP